MFLSADVISLVLYCAQQLGVTLGVGAQTIMLVAYLSAMRDGVVDAKEAQFARAVRRVLMLGLVLIVLSGIGITMMHIVSGQTGTVLAAAYLFKWILVVSVVVFTVLNQLPQKIMQGLAGGSWYALFIVHILAPVASWANLLTLYVVWMIGFFLCWIALTYATKDKSVQIAVPVKAQPKPAAQPAKPPALPKPITPQVQTKPVPPPQAPVMQKPTVHAAAVPVKPAVPPPALPAVPKPPAVIKTVPPPVNLPVSSPQHILQTLPQPQVEKKPLPQAPKEQNPWLPSIRVMPKTPGDADKLSQGTDTKPQA